ncbi:TetR/AcrR family transcriptional regulator [Streptomyces daliensis]|uniref:TetR/AcrR family transcriptional regulator n=1 Tax=Streptomyces daliensis TaxID=299421 RepID=A0A8T4IXY1_9ACTN|nr:TetR/AcrR family transcriptional regulator [Streptomyces daliensis]
MPRQIDHEGRRLRIADAVCLLADERGLEGVTLRDVAARADVSMGAVQRCFRTKEEMLVFALTHIGELVGARVRARVVESPAQSARSTLGHTVTEVALVREEHRAQARVWLAFLAQAAVTPSLAGVLRDNYAGLHAVLVRLIGEAVDGSGDSGPVPGTESSARAGQGSDQRHTREARYAREAREAHTLLALADGLTAHVLIGHLTPEEALGVLDGHLGRLWQHPEARRD